MVVTAPVSQLEMSPLKALWQVAPRNTVKKKVREETVFKTSLQLTVVHVRHCSGLPGGDVAVEGTGLVKHWKKKVVREETKNKHITTTYCRSWSSLGRSASWRGRC